MQKTKILAICVLCACCSCESMALDLAKDRKPVAEIVVTADACPSTKSAASELQKYLEKMSGAKLPIVHNPGKMTPIYVGPSEHTQKLGIKTSDIKYDGFKIIVNDKYAAIVGVDENRPPIPRGFTDFRKHKECQAEWEKATGTKTSCQFYFDPRRSIQTPDGPFTTQDATGTLYGVYALLESLGVRFFMPVEGLGQVVPQMPDISLANREIKEEPDFAFRYLSMTSQGENLDKYWYKQLRQGGVYSPWPAHTAASVTMDKTRNELFIFRNGTRMDKPRLASPELRSELANYLVNMKKFYPEIAQLPIGQPDGWTVLDDRDVKAGWDKKSEGDLGRFSDYTWDFVLDVAKQVQAKIPGAKLCTFSYGYAKKTPKLIDKIPGNIGIYFTQNSTQWRTNPEDLKLRKEWEAKAPDSELYIYDYYLTHNPSRNAPALPHIYTANIEKNFKALGPQYKGLFVEISHGGPEFLKSKYRSLMKYPVLNALTYYVHGKLSWNKNTDLKTILDDFYEKFFGPAQNEMREFYEFAEKMWMTPPASNQDKRAMVDKYFEILDRAKAKAGNTDYAARIGLIAEEMEPAKKAFMDTRSGPVLNLPKMAGPVPEIDGDLEKEFWKGKLEMQRYWMKDNITGVYPGKYKAANVKLRWVNGVLLAGITCMERDMGKIKAAVPRGPTDSNEIYSDDNVEIYLETTSGYRIKLVINPNGATLAKLITSPDVTEITWMPEAVAVKKYDDRWTVEVNLGKFSGDPPSVLIPWGVNVCRQRQAGGERELYALSPTGGRFENFEKNANLSMK